MSLKGQGRRIVPFSIAAAMLAVIIGLGLMPNALVAQASSSCTYGSCPSTATFPPWAIGSSVAIVLVGLLVGLLLLRRRRRKQSEYPVAPAGPEEPVATPEPEAPEGSEPAEGLTWSEPTTDEGESAPTDDTYRES